MVFLADRKSTGAKDILSEDSFDPQRAQALLATLGKKRNFQSAALILVCATCGHKEPWGPRQDGSRCLRRVNALSQCQGILGPPEMVKLPESEFRSFGNLRKIGKIGKTGKLVLDAFEDLWPETTRKELLKRTELPPRTLDYNLSRLAEEGLVTSRRQGHWQLAPQQP